jgi:S-adenosylmethionine hydrolase
MRYRIVLSFFLYCILAAPFEAGAQNQALVFQSDFGLKDGAVAAMKGVAFSVSPELRIFDVTHEITAFNIQEAAYRLNQVAAYWPAGTVFVSIVDPGVGSARRSLVMKTNTGHFFVSPDNGTLTLVAEALGVHSVREIDESRNRLKGSQQSYTFHGRDVYAYTGARLAARVISFEEVGPKLKDDIIRLPLSKPVFSNGEIQGTIPVLDIQYGNVWTNIDEGTFRKLGVHPGDSVRVKIFKDKELKYEGTVRYANTFSEVEIGQPIGYLNSLLNFSLGINQGNFAEQYSIGTGEGWRVVVMK